METRKIKYKSSKIIIGYSNYNFSHYVIKQNGYLIIIYGAGCNNKSEILHQAIKKTR